MMQRRLKMGGSGRITIPAAHRKALGLEIGDELILRIEQDELRIASPRLALERARSLIARYVPDHEDLVQGLINERRAEVARE